MKNIKNVVIYFFAFSILISITCSKQSINSANKKYLETLIEYEGEQLYIVTNNIVIPFFEESNNRGKYSCTYQLHNYEEIIRDKSEYYSKKYKLNDSSTVYVIPVDFFERRRPRFSIGRDFYKDGTKASSDVYNRKRGERCYMFKIIDANTNTSKCINPYDNSIYYIDIKKQEIHLKNSFIGKVEIPNFFEYFKETFSKINVLVKIYEPREDFGEKKLKLIVEEIKTLFTLDIKEIDYLFFDYNSINNFVNSIDKKLVLDNDHPLFFNIMENN